MQNQSSPAQLLFPAVPSNYCPTGAWSDIFNSFITLYLNNGTINIPGLGQVTPAQIATINQNILNLQNSLTALQTTINGFAYISGIQGILASASAQKYTINLPSAMSSATYNINGYFEPTAGTATSNCSWGVVAGSATTTSFQIWIFNPAANTDITNFYWSVNTLPSS